MAQYINREKLLKRMEGYCKANCGCKPYEDSLCPSCGLGDAIYMVEEQRIVNSKNMRGRKDATVALSKMEKTTRWIPVTEQLPEFDQKVLAWVKNKDQEGRFNKDGIYTAELKDKMPKPDPEGKRNFWGIPGYDSVWTVWSWSYFTEPDVLFWMPLPEPPKEGE